MRVFLSSSIIGNSQNLITIGAAGELMGWFYPHKDHSQHINSCLPCVYLGHGGQGFLSYLYDAPFQSRQAYIGDSNALETVVSGHGLQISFQDVIPDDLPVLIRRIRVENIGDQWRNGGIYHLSHFQMGGMREGNSISYDATSNTLTQNHREAALCVGGDALSGHHVGKAGANWQNNARYALDHGILAGNELEIGDINFAAGFYFELSAGESVEKTLFLALGITPAEARANLEIAQKRGFETILKDRIKADTAFLNTSSHIRWAKEDESLLSKAFKRSLLAMPLLCGEEGVAVAAPEFDPEFIACGGYGYFWPRDGAEYVSGFMDAGYPEFAIKMFDWCAKHQADEGLWHQRYFLNGVAGPNWCLPPERLQVDQVGAVGWAYGKYLELHPEFKVPAAHKNMLIKAADYLISRQDEVTGVLKNAFDTWETFIGSFTYSNASAYAHLLTTAKVTKKKIYADAANKMKQGVLNHFVRESQNGEYKYLVRGFLEDGSPDETVDSASLGAIEPFGLLDLSNPDELALAIGTIRAVTERLEVDWQGSKAIRRFEGDAYVGGVPACVNTLWMARCCLLVAEKTGDEELLNRAEGFLNVVLKRATPTLLLPELMQGPEGQSYWAAPHGWAMASFVSGILKLRQLKSA
jgi:glucoamylase